MLVLVSMVAGGGFLLSWLELRSGQAYADSVAAFYLSDGALQEALARVMGAPPASQTLSLGPGRATVTSTRLIHLGYGEALYRILSVGTANAARGETFARTVGVVALVAEPPLLPAALTVSGSITGGVTTGTISGVDISSACGRYPGSISGVALPAGVPLAIGPGLQLSGSPPVQTHPAGATLRRVTGLDWPGLLSAHGPARDATIPPDPWPSGSSAGSPTWPLIELLSSPARLDSRHSGRGALIVRGDLEIGGGFSWHGLILVGGALRALGDARLDGAAIIGLDSAAVPSPLIDLGSGRVEFRFDSCAVEAAALRIAPSPVAEPGTWHEVL
jgi:hypothetical protein